VADIFSFLLEHQDIRGPVNFTAPMPVTNREMLATLNRLCGRRPLIPGIPGWTLRAAMGEFANVFLEGQRARPAVLTQNGFVFRFPTFESAVTDLVGLDVHTGTRTP
jgi:uncharacterized protein